MEVKNWDRLAKITTNVIHHVAIMGPAEVKNAYLRSKYCKTRTNIWTVFYLEIDVVPIISVLLDAAIWVLVDLSPDVFLRHL